MRFTAIVQDCFALPEGRVGVLLTEIEGMPEVGHVVRVQGGDPEGPVGRIVEVGRNSTDGQVVSTRSCLTGKSVAPYGAIAVVCQRPPDAGLFGQRMEGSRDV